MSDKTERRYQFTWEMLGDLRQGRPNLGPFTRVEVYRLMQFSLRDALEERLGSQQADQLFRQAGHLAGRHFHHHLVGPSADLPEFLAKLRDILRDLQVGVLRVEEADLEAGRVVLTVSEDLDCSGLPETQYEFCAYDEGFIAGLLESYSGRRFAVREIDCWTTGARTCRFVASLATG